MIDNTIESIDFLKETIKELYAIELIFQDFKINEININKDDTKFIIPYEEKRRYLKNILNCAFDNEKEYNRVYYMIVKEAKKTLINNSQNIDKLLKYAITLALN
jgi:hypothetical protein